MTPDPCPFCKKAGLGIAVHHGTLSARSEACVLCKWCGAQGPKVSFKHHKGLSEADSDKAIRYWNQAGRSWNK